MKEKVLFFSIKHPLSLILLLAIFVKLLALIFTDGLLTEVDFNYYMIPQSWMENPWIVYISRLLLGAFSLLIITIAYRITKIIADKTTALEIATFGALLWGMTNIWIDYLIRLAASLVCGFCLGFERKMRQHTVGIRTLTLLSVSSCLLTIASSFLASTVLVEGDPTRIAAAVITGIGFLGAGAIVNQGLNIRGLTSAAIIFTSAALGVACGAKLYIPVVIVLSFSFILLLIIGPLERKLFPADKRKLFKIVPYRYTFFYLQF